ncbi:MAG: queuosine salvage family protein [Candidatus Sericytochromatia bacterium]|nr:queuosine salvage family protein [Candidatus Sericytochromatia bacterium]
MRPDPFGVRAAAAWVLGQTKLVTVVPEAVGRVAAAWELSALPGPPSWEDGWHWRGDLEDTAQFVLVLDVLNHCFWPGRPRWSVPGPGGEQVNGYRALAHVLAERARTGQRDLLDAESLASMTPGRLEALLGGTGELPWLAERAAHLREAGAWLLRSHGGHFLRVVQASRGSGVALGRSVLEELSSFRDIPLWRGRSLPMLKRLQILVADVATALGGDGGFVFGDLDGLTAFADYKVPQVLEALGILCYAPDLREALLAGQELEWGSEPELALRAGTIVAVDELTEALAARGHQVRPLDVDVHLWTLGQEMDLPVPYHRTRTWFY